MTYQSPGVYIEEVPSGPQPIAAASTSVVAILGDHAQGPAAHADPGHRLGGLRPHSSGAAHAPGSPPSPCSASSRTAARPPGSSASTRRSPPPGTSATRRRRCRFAAHGDLARARGRTRLTSTSRRTPPVAPGYDGPRRGDRGRSPCTAGTIDIPVDAARAACRRATPSCCSDAAGTSADATVNTVSDDDRERHRRRPRHRAGRGRRRRRAAPRSRPPSALAAGIGHQARRPAGRPARRRLAGHRARRHRRADGPRMVDHARRAPLGAACPGQVRPAVRPLPRHDRRRRADRSRSARSPGTTTRPLVADQRGQPDGQRPGDRLHRLRWRRSAGRASRCRVARTRRPARWTSRSQVRVAGATPRRSTWSATTVARRARRASASCRSARRSS